jgi:hypothetical protein
VEAISRLVTESLARYGLDRPVDPRRLQWSRWFRCDSPHSLLVVPSKPGIFAIAEEVMTLADGGAAAALVRPGNDHVGTAALASPAERSSDEASDSSRRMLAVLQFSEDDDMAYTLDRMFTRENPMRGRLASGRCFLRFVVIENQAQRRSICSALNQWMLSSADKASGLPTDFFSSLEVTPAGVGRAPSPVERRTPPSARDTATLLPALAGHENAATAAHMDSGSATNLHCPHPLPSGF